MLSNAIYCLKKCEHIFLVFFGGKYLEIKADGILRYKMVYDLSLDCKTMYVCEKCDIKTSNKKDYKKHLLTAKHGKNSANGICTIEKSPENHNLSPKHKSFECECGKKYAHTSGLYRHRKTCTKPQQDKPVGLFIDPLKQQELILHLLKDNQEFKELMIEQHKTQLEQHKTQIEQNEKMIESMKETKVVNHITNNTQNNHFNMQIFLNEKCANALNIMDFINQLNLQITDLEMVGQLGDVEGISKIMVRELKELDVTKRPIHCSDLKREVMYIKDNNAWEKDNEEKEKMKNAIKYVAHKNVKQIKEWQNVYPEYQDPKSKKNEQFMVILNKSCGGADEEEDNKNYGKIIKNVAKQVLIDK